jgi:citronellyl-CoA synthetase
MVKGDLRKQAYDPELVDDALYVMKPGAAVYEPLSAEFAEQIKAGSGGY